MTKSLCCSGMFRVYRGWHPTQLYGDYDKPLQGFPYEPISIIECHEGFFVAQCMGNPSFVLYHGSRQRCRNKVRVLRTNQVYLKRCEFSQGSSRAESWSHGNLCPKAYQHMLPTNTHIWRVVIFLTWHCIKLCFLSGTLYHPVLVYLLHVCKKDFSPKLPINIPTARDRPSPRLRKNHIPSLRLTASLNPWKWMVGRHVYIGMPSSLPSSSPRCTGKKHHQDLEWHEISGFRILRNLQSAWVKVSSFYGLEESFIVLNSGGS